MVMLSYQDKGWILHDSVQIYLSINKLCADFPYHLKRIMFLG